MSDERIERLREVLHRFDGGMSQQEEAARRSGKNELGNILREIRRETPYSWGMSNHTRPSDLFCGFLKEGVVQAEAAQEKLTELSEYEIVITAGRIERLPEHLRGQFLFDKWGDYELNYFEQLENAITEAENVKDLFEDVRDFFAQSTDDTYVFMKSCMSHEELKLLRTAYKELDQPIELLNDMLEETKEIRESRLLHIIQKADQKNAELVAWLKEHENAFDMMDLKLHDASFYEYKDLEDNFPAVYKANEEGYYGSDSSPFYSFCESTYDQFTDWMDEQNIDWNKMHHQVGRTSSFYLHDEGNFIVLNRRDYSIDVPNTLSCITDSLGYAYSDLCYDEQGKLDREYIKENYPNGMDTLLMIASGEMKDDAIKKLEDVIRVYEYIKDIKENQVEYFKDYLEQEEEYVKEEYGEERE